MTYNSHSELPIRSKRIMAQDVAEIIQCLHKGDRSYANLLIEDLKIRAINFDLTVQQDVLMFVESVQFQAVYDPWHKVTPDIEIAANRLLSDLGIWL